MMVLAVSAGAAWAAEKVLAVAAGEQAKNEVCGAQGIAIVKDGVTL